ncbi:MAG: HAD-IB family hydrolase [Alphaproteobacteria bacterium]|nr:HAD-IB family hydrolase [Alphaproteobacteria bacterium]
MSIAFFDFDKTLIHQNSGSLWVRAELRGGYIGWGMAARATWWIARYHLGLSGLDEAVLDAVATLAGQRESDIRARTDRFYDAEVKPLFRPAAILTLQQHRAAGDRLVLLSTTSNYLAERVGMDLRMDALLCNRFEVDDHGVFTGRPDGPLCFGDGKLVHARAYAASLGVPLSETSFYTDSFTDLPVMEAVGRPVAVNPDPRLRREATRRGWPVVDWGP